MFAARKMYSIAPSFSHIYVERAAFKYPASAAILQRFPKAQIVEIENYKETFNRYRQDQRAQKKSQKIILAVRRDNFLYPGTSVMPDFGHKNFFYNLLAINCIYDCQYCYLQGMYSSANLVLFVNNPDYFDATEDALRRLGPIYLCISYDTDLLALENIYPYCREWIEFARSRPDLLIEIRTKSSNFAAIADLQACPNVILAWTLSPQTITSVYEKSTPALSARLRAAKEAGRNGWKIRLCIDPIILVPEWETQYKRAVQEVFNVLDPAEIYDVSLGTLRFNSEHFCKIRAPKGPLGPLEQNLLEQGGIVAYAADDQVQLVNSLRTTLLNHLPANKIFNLPI